ncbi:hypothetical protein ACFX5Q_11440 [Mesorhizobium sp. IMUNJ 23033]|uniref:hypothetical protein n=1 Tax=Mesorhizobium sp. IMUNJ 23033 TaxID=3378039 RepID=UPI0038503A48
MEEFVGFYWTRPVNWAGFRKLPKDVEQAAKRSKTIRYQCERVRRWVRSNAGILVREFVFIERDPEEATSSIRVELGKAIEVCLERQCTLVHVDFGAVQMWRRHSYMRDILRVSGLKPIGLPPDSIDIDGRLFDPISHFQDWRNTEFLRRDEHRRRVRRVFAEAEERIPEGRGRPKAIAGYLNNLGITTLTGLPWTDETVRKFKASTSRG